MVADVHVVPDGDAWAVEIDGKKRGRFQTQSEAISRAGQLAGEEGGELVIHRMDRQIREDNSRDASDMKGEQHG
jgi:hypothetical protein